MKFRRRTASGGLRIILVLAALATATIFLLQRLDRPGGRLAGEPPSATPGDLPGEPSPSPDSSVLPARVAIVIDDVGFKKRPVIDLTHLGLPFAFAILPHQRYSRELASYLSAAGFEVILHMPMEPLAYPTLDPGEGAVGPGMSSLEVRRAVEIGLAEVPQAAGLNNHMGSRSTADIRVMETILDVVRLRGLYFLDSRTTNETVGFALARRMGIPALERGVFLDDRREASYIEGQVRSLLRKAREEGTVVAIGHPDAVTVEVLRRSVDLFRQERVQVVPASELARQADGTPG